MHVCSKCTINFALHFGSPMAFFKKIAVLKLLHFLLSTKLLHIFRNCFCFRSFIFFASISIISLCLSCTVECRCSMFLIILISSHLLYPFYIFQNILLLPFSSIWILSFLPLTCIALFSSLYQMINSYQLISGHLSYFHISQTSFLFPPLEYKCSISFSRSPPSQCTKI
jgi:hypothetical protein